MCDSEQCRCWARPLLLRGARRRARRWPTSRPGRCLEPRRLRRRGARVGRPGRRRRYRREFNLGQAYRLGRGVADRSREGRGALCQRGGRRAICRRRTITACMLFQDGAPRKRRCPIVPRRRRSRRSALAVSARHRPFQRRPGREGLDPRLCADDPGAAGRPAAGDAGDGGDGPVHPARAAPAGRRPRASSAHEADATRAPASWPPPSSRHPPSAAPPPVQPSLVSRMPRRACRARSRPSGLAVDRRRARGGRRSEPRHRDREPGRGRRELRPARDVRQWRPSVRTAAARP